MPKRTELIFIERDMISYPQNLHMWNEMLVVLEKRPRTNFVTSENLFKMISVLFIYFQVV